MICERCLKELNAAFDFAERSRSAEKLYFVKRREEIEAEKKKAEKAIVPEVKAEYEESKIKREPSIEIETVEIPMFDESEANSRISFEDDEIDADGEEETPQMFSKIPVSTNKKNKKIQKTSQGNQQFQCSICNKTFSTNTNLQRHIKTVHEKIKRFTCAHCPKSFYRKEHLQRHIARCHTFTNDSTTNSNRPFECDIDNCGKFFKTKRDLKLHQRRVHSGEFPLIILMFDHKLSFQFTDDQRFQCHCGKTFSRKDRLKTHQLKLHKKKSS
jgi:uncharacterized Zn-finger protein